VRLVLFLIMVHRYDSGADTGSIAIGGRGPVASEWFVSAAAAYLYWFRDSSHTSSFLH
jgi:hypothetical protein